MINLKSIYEQYQNDLEFKNRIKNFPIQQLVDKLQLKLTKSGNSLQGDCPTGHPSQNHRCFSINIQDNYWHCFHCNEGGDNIKLIQIVKSCSFPEAIEWAKNELNISENHQISNLNDDETLNEEDRVKGLLYEAAFEFLHEKLFTEEGKEAFIYLTEVRKYDPDVLKNSEFCAFLSDREIKNYLKSQFPDAEEIIETLNFYGAFGDNFKLALPYRNRKGLITGFIKRSTVSEGITISRKNGEIQTGIRYDSTKGTSKQDLFNLDKCKGQETIIIVEGYPDAVYLYAAGIKNITAVGQGLLSQTHLTGLKENNVKNVIIAFDNDNVGPVNTEKAIKLILKETEIQPFVIDPRDLGNAKDPDEYFRNNGFEQLKKLFEKPIYGISWLVRNLSQRFDLTNDLQKQEAFSKAIKLEEILRDDYDREILIKSISETFKLSIEVVRKQLKTYNDFIKRYKQELYLLNKNLESGLKNNEFDEISNSLIDFIAKSNDYKSLFEVKQENSLYDTLLEKFKLDDTRDPDKLLGLELTNFKEFAKNIDGVQPGFYIIAAEPHIGKTAFMTGLCLDLLETNQDVKVLYYSLDDSNLYTAYRFLSILTDFPINKTQRKQKNVDDKKKLAEGRKKLLDLISTRLVIKDIGDIQDISQIDEDIRQMKESSKIVVFIDGLFNLNVGDSSDSSIRAENIKRANSIKKLVDTYEIPVFTTAEIRKKLKTESEKKKPSINDIMETGKFAYNANLILLMYPTEIDKVKKDEFEVTIEFAKNKLSSFRAEQTLKFERIKGKFREKDNSKDVTVSETKKEELI